VVLDRWMGGFFFAGKGGCGVRVLELVGVKLCEDLRRGWTRLAEGVRWRMGVGDWGKGWEGVWCGWGGVGGCVARKKGGSMGWLVGWLGWEFGERGCVCVCVVQRWISVKRSVEIVFARRG